MEEILNHSELSSIPFEGAAVQNDSISYKNDLSQASVNGPPIDQMIEDLTGFIDKEDLEMNDSHDSQEFFSLEGSLYKS